MSATHHDTEPPDLDSGDALPSCIGSRYEVLERLGRGGMAVVYRVRDRSRPGELALKQWLAAGSAQHDTRSLFENEFRALAQLRHPSVVEVYDFGFDSAGPYYTMELLDSGDLNSHAPVPFRQACELIAQVCSALSLLHSRRLLHRDISPRNVRLTRQGHAKLIDFGAMVPMGPCAQGVGTPGFVAPEVVRHLPLDARTDLFSVGATLYYALTGRRPFSARTLAELPEAWRRDPAPPSELIAGIPEALDTLVLSLLRMGPATRPSRAFEVMQRLAAISGRPLAESAEIARAYLSTPVLVGRDAQQRRFRQFLRRAVQGIGAGVLFQGASGSGRTRLLDACVLEAKTGGATVLRVDGRAARREAFAGARRLAEQLLEAFPDCAQSCADDAGVCEVLFSPSAGATKVAKRELRPLARWSEDTYAVQAALFAWLQRMCREQPLVIAADDSERIDAQSLALLVALVDAASDVPMLLMIAARNAIDANAQPALSALQERCTILQLEPLAADETDALFASMFSDVPHASLVSARIHRVTAGNPREVMVLAQHMLDRQLIRYTDGQWILPASLALSELPASAEDALRSQLAELPELPRRLAEAQALALDAPWTDSDYSELAAATMACGETNPERMAVALALLMRQGVIVEHAGAYTLTHPGVRACLVAQLTAADRTSHQLVLADWCTRTQRHGLVEVYHLLHAHSFERALERLAALLDGPSSVAALYHASGVELKVIAEIIEQAHALSRERGRKPRETHEMARLLLELSVSTEEALYHRYAPAWLAQLELDSGLADYRAADASLQASARLQRALEHAIARYANTPESQRVYPLDQAIKQLAHFAVVSIVNGVRTLDTKLLASLPGVLEPFSTLSPVLYALWQNAIATNELTYKGQYEQARARELDVYRRLESVTGRDVAYLDAIRGAIASAVACMEVTIGYPTAQHWISIMEQHPLQRVMALHLRRALCILDGDADGAERFRKQAEVLALQSGARSMFDTPLAIELYLQVHVGDLTAVKHAADRIAQLAAKWPGWGAQHQLAQGFFHRMRGDLPAAKAAFELALAAAQPDRVDPPPMLGTWIAAVEGYVGVLTECGELQRAREFGLLAIERCEALGISAFYGHLRPLALAEAKLGDHASAAGRLDAMIAQRAQLRPSVLLLDYEVRARVAILAGDGPTAAHFTRLATQSDAAVGGVRQLATRARLVDEARRTGINLDVPLSGFEPALRSERAQPAPVHAAQSLVAAAIAHVNDPAARAQRALELLAKALDASTGQLYYASAAQLLCAAVLGPREPTLDRFANGYWRQRQTQSGLTTVFTAPQTDTFALPTGEWTSPTGILYRIIPLSPLNEPECVGLVALCTDAKAFIPGEYWWLSAAISARLLASGDVAAASSVR